jgi:ferredoxin-NADP reductase
MSTYTVTLTKKELVAQNTLALHFNKPEGFTYIAGQYADFTLTNPPETDEEGNKRTFSFTSAPYESDLVITTRLRDTAFKRTLKDLTEGSTIQLDGPFGSLVLPKNVEKTAVFLSGGIGCTLVRSMVTQATHDHLPHKIAFFYLNPSPERTTYLDEFTALATENKNFLFVPIITDDSKEWTRERGTIDKAMLEKYIAHTADPIYYLSGPGSMVGDMRKLLLSIGVDRTNIRADQFIGY